MAGSSRPEESEFSRRRWDGPRRRVAALAVLAALTWAAWSAGAAWWTTDDAFISFRYARNLVEGRGLVFNEGERVEGYTNPLWTLWSAAGLALGLRAEWWCNGWSLAAYLLSILLLALNSAALARRRSPREVWLPLAAVGAAAHREWQIFATGGLETAMFTLLLIAGYLLVVWCGERIAWAAGAGFVFALAALTRHDGLLPALVAGLYLLAFAAKRWKSAAIYAACFAALWVPFTVWRMGYYGDFFPNSYYAKSAYATWYSQGLLYLRLYLEKYWALALGPLLLAVAAMRKARGRRARWPWSSPESRQILLSSAFAVAYGFYVVRVGGDFMFARFFIPATPFLLILFERGWSHAIPSRPYLSQGLALAVLVAMILTPPPVTGSRARYGVVDEWEYYSPERTARLDHAAEVLGEYFADLPVRVAFYGDQARIVYKARFAWAVESHAGLNEPVVARREIERRGRVGHEKYPSARYLIEELGVQFTFSRVPDKMLRLDHYIPRIYVMFDEQVYGRVLLWDPTLMEALRRRGARFPDFDELLDHYIGTLDRLTREQVAEHYERMKRFYFDPVGDPAREAVFRERLKLG